MAHIYRTSCLPHQSPHRTPTTILSNIQRIHNDALLPPVPQRVGHILRGALIHHGTHQIQRRVHARRPRIAGNDPQPTESQIRAPRTALPPQITLAEAKTALARMTAPSSLLVALNLFEFALVHHERVFIHVAQIEARIVDNVHFLHDLGAIGGGVGARLLTLFLELDVVVGVPRRRQALQHACAREEEGGGPDGDERAFAHGIIRLHLAEGLDEGDQRGAVVVFEHAFGMAAAGDDEDVDVAQALVRFFVVDVGGDGVALGGRDGFGFGGGQARKGFFAGGLVEGGLQDGERAGVFEEVDAVAFGGGG